ncbi:MAG: GntR family transcriptional regulator, partial [Lachnospiraceae bacterium]|nr:GntR family transcriptional regulator [Lachnospiraceae bacterium]
IFTELELSEKYDVSRITVRKAVTLLVDEGILVKQHGIGTFVAKQKINRHVNIIMGFTQSCESEGKKASATLLAADTIEAEIRDCEILGLNEGDRIIRIKRVRYCDGLPVCIEEEHFSLAYSFILAEDLTRSLTTILEEHGIYMEGGSKTIDICYSNEEEREILGLEEGQALILQKEIVFSQNRVPLFTGKQVLDASRYHLIMQW